MTSGAINIPVMPHEFTISGRNSRASLDSLKSSPHQQRPGSSMTALKTSSNNSPSTMALTATSTAPRKPSQLGLYCTDKENGRHSGGGVLESKHLTAVPSSANQVAAVKTTPVPTPKPNTATHHNVPKHIYDSSTKTFYTVVKFLGKVNLRVCLYEPINRFKWRICYLL